VAVASLGTAVGSSSARGLEGTSRSTDGANALAAGRDGKLVAAGLSRRGSHGPRFALARYTAGGTLDRRFGTRGKVLTGFGGARSVAGASSLAIRPDGRIVVAGYAYVPPKSYPGFAIARYTVAGKLDRTFGQNGKVVTYFDSARRASAAKAVAIQRDGKVVAVGHSYDSPSFGRFRFALARYTLRGRLDRSFGRGGTVQTDFGAHGGAIADAAAIQPDGKIVAAGHVSRDSGTVVALARYNADGTRDRSFGQGGRVETKVGEGFSYAAAIVGQPDGKLVVAGRAYVKPDGDFALVRYTADGRLDPSFGRGGVVVTNAGNAWALAIQRDRKLVTAGADVVTTPGADDGPRFALARFLEDGSPDEGFGRNGKLLTDFHAIATANAVVVRANGKIVAAGTVGGSPWRDFALARYTSSGRLDGSFGSGGKVLTDFGSLWAIRGR
jgi:uncharacterized delta-60 repeat protein